MAQLEGRSLVFGFDVAAEPIDGFQAIDVITGVALTPAYQPATPGLVNKAVESATLAAAPFRQMPGTLRAAFLRAVAARIDALTQQLIDRAGRETGFLPDRIRNETSRTTAQLRMFAELAEDNSWIDARIDTALPGRTPDPRPDIRSILRPIGPVAIFGAGNFPLAFSVAGGDVASALAAGCPVVVKAHPGHPGTSELTGRAVMEAASAEQMPSGVFSLLFDDGHCVGESLVQHPLIKAVAFTGSLRGGRRLFALASSREVPIPLFAEMSSANPVFLLPGALRKRGAQIAEGLHRSVTMGTGQFCTKPGLVFTDGNTGFRERLIELMAASPASPFVGSRTARGFQEGLKRTMSCVDVKRIVCPSQSSETEATGPYLFETSVTAFMDNPALADEIFGPATILVRYRDMYEALEAAKSLPGQLTATIHAEDDEREASIEILETLAERVGRLVFNQFPTGVEVCHAMVHGGPYPATTDSRYTSVGATAIRRFVRPICYQNFPDPLLPVPLQGANPLRLRRLIDGKLEP